VTPRDLAGKRVVVLGLARQGTALVKYLARRGARVTVSDRKPAAALQAEIKELKGITVDYELGGHPLDLLEGIDLLCLSGGVPVDLPVVAEARKRNIPLCNDTQLFLEHAPAKVVGITGSSGKTTTTTLVGRMAARAAAEGRFRKAWVGGNIGNPLLNDVERMDKDDVAVVELSSFQLELTGISPQVAAILNITPNHLDRHHTLDAYRRAKARILEFQSRGDDAVLGWDSPETRALAAECRGRRWFFRAGEKDWDGAGAYVRDGWIVVDREGSSGRVIAREAVRLRGEHNLANAAAACAIGAAAGFSDAALAGAIEGFRGVPHRLEFVARRRGADWYNDSIATAPERAIAAIRSFSEPIVLLAGGRDKQLPWTEWARLVNGRVDRVVLFGEAADLIGRALEENPAGGRSAPVSRAATLADAVERAAAVVRPGSVVLLSPGGTSYDAYKDFEERGEDFRRLVAALEDGER
jgi:UDP-N-acetylmuramoylalanine--D-glutamate ligase